MTNALDIAYASNSETPIDTVEFIHSGLTGGYLRLASNFTDLDVILEDASSATFQASGLDIKLPEKSVDGKPSITINISNIDNRVYEQINQVINQSRTSNEEVVCKYRAFVPSDLTQPASSTILLLVKRSFANRVVATISAEYNPIPDTVFPRGRYYPTKFPGVKYAG